MTNNTDTDGPRFEVEQGFTTKRRTRYYVVRDHLTGKIVAGSATLAYDVAVQNARDLNGAAHAAVTA